MKLFVTLVSQKPTSLHVGCDLSNSLEGRCQGWLPCLPPSLPPPSYRSNYWIRVMQSWVPVPSGILHPTLQPRNPTPLNYRYIFMRPQKWKRNFCPSTNVMPRPPVHVSIQEHFNCNPAIIHTNSRTPEDYGEEVSREV